MNRKIHLVDRRFWLLIYCLRQWQYIILMGNVFVLIWLRSSSVMSLSLLKLIYGPALGQSDKRKTSTTVVVSSVSKSILSILSKDKQIMTEKRVPYDSMWEVHRHDKSIYKSIKVCSGEREKKESIQFDMVSRGGRQNSLANNRKMH